MTLGKPWRISSITFWNKSGAEITPKVNRMYRYNPQCVLMVRNCWDSSIRGICWYPDERSQALWISSLRSGSPSGLQVWAMDRHPHQGIGLWWFPQTRRVPSLLWITTKGAAQSLWVTFSIIPPSSSRSGSFSNDSCKSKRCRARADNNGLQLTSLWNQSSAPSPPRKPQSAPGPLPSPPAPPRLNMPALGYDSLCSQSWPSSVSLFTCTTYRVCEPV